MKLAFYYDTEEDFYPFDYFIKTNIDNCKILGSNRKKQIKSDLIEKIETIRENRGFPVEGISGPLKGYKFNKIKQAKNENTLFRVLYYNYKGFVILLDGFEKPREYSGKKEERKIKKHYERASFYCENIKKDFYKHIKEA